jgi:hypothetical protein
MIGPYWFKSRRSSGERIGNGDEDADDEDADDDDADASLLPE